MNLIDHIEHRAFFVVGPGEVLDAVLDYENKMKKFRKHFKECGDLYGFETALSDLSAVIFETESPAGSGWKKAFKKILAIDPRAYSPNKKTKEGKAIYKKLMEVKKPRKLAIEPSSVWTDIEGSRPFSCVILNPTYDRLGEKIILILPKDTAAQEIPTPQGCEPILASEYVRLVELANAGGEDA